MHHGIHENKQRVGQTENGLGSTEAASNRLLVHYSLSRRLKLSSVHGVCTQSAYTVGAIWHLEIKTFQENLENKPGNAEISTTL